MEKSLMLAGLRHYFNTTAREEIQKEWAAIECEDEILAFEYMEFLMEIFPEEHDKTRISACDPDENMAPIYSGLFFSYRFAS